MEPIGIRRATLNDLDDLQKIGRQTFSETFSASNTEENMTKYLEEGFAIEKMSAELNNPNSEIYFAELDGKVIGYLKLNFGSSQTELKDDKALEIERIYVLKDYHGKKVGQLLYEKAMQIAGRKMPTMSGWVFGKKTQEPSTSIRRTDSLPSTSTFSIWVMTSRPTS